MFCSSLNLCCATDAKENDKNINVPNVSAINSLSQSFRIRRMLFTLYLHELKYCVSIIDKVMRNKKIILL